MLNIDQFAQEVREKGIDSIEFEPDIVGWCKEGKNGELITYCKSCALKKKLKFRPKNTIDRIDIEDDLFCRNCGKEIKNG